MAVCEGGEDFYIARGGKRAELLVSPGEKIGARRESVSHPVLKGERRRPELARPRVRLG